MKILLTNDDGITAPGLEALIRELDSKHECLVAAPASEKSASSHSISLGQKLFIEERGPNRYAIRGTPADCVKLALSELKKTFKPELIVSGINPGPNTGVSVYYSGTISAAREGLINQIPAMAVSVRVGRGAVSAPKGRGNPAPADFSFSASFTRGLVVGYEEGVFPRNIFLNVTIPDLPESKIRGIKVARQAPSRFIEEFIAENVWDHKRTYRLAGEIQVFDPDGTTDEEVSAQGFIAITPLKLDLTDYSAMPVLEHWFQKRQEPWPSPKTT